MNTLPAITFTDFGKAAIGKIITKCYPGIEKLTAQDTGSASVEILHVTCGGASRGVYVSTGAAATPQTSQIVGAVTGLCTPKLEQYVARALQSPACAFSPVRDGVSWGPAVEIPFSSKYSIATAFDHNTVAAYLKSHGSLYDWAIKIANGTTAAITGPADTSGYITHQEVLLATAAQEALFGLVASIGFSPLANAPVFLSNCQLLATNSVYANHSKHIIDVNTAQMAQSQNTRFMEQWAADHRYIRVIINSPWDAPIYGAFTNALGAAGQCVVFWVPVPWYNGDEIAIHTRASHNTEIGNRDSWSIGFDHWKPIWQAAPAHQFSSGKTSVFVTATGKLWATSPMEVLPLTSIDVTAMSAADPTMGEKRSYKVSIDTSNAPPGKYGPSVMSFNAQSTVRPGFHTSRWATILGPAGQFFLDYMLTNTLTATAQPVTGGAVNITVYEVDLLNVIEAVSVGWGWYDDYLTTGFGLYTGLVGAALDKARTDASDLNGKTFYAVDYAAGVAVPNDVVLQLDIHTQYADACKKACQEDDFLEQAYATDGTTWGVVNDTFQRRSSKMTNFCTVGEGVAAPIAYSDPAAVDATGVSFTVTQAGSSYTITSSGSKNIPVVDGSVVAEYLIAGAGLTGPTAGLDVIYGAGFYSRVTLARAVVVSSDANGKRADGANIPCAFTVGALTMAGYPFYHLLPTQDAYKMAIASVMQYREYAGVLMKILRVGMNPVMIAEHAA